jgi:hypothetical protein
MAITTFPVAETAGGGLNFELIASITMATGSPTSITFSGIDSKYKVLKLVVVGTESSSTTTPGIRINGITAGGNYAHGTRHLAANTWSTLNSAANTNIVIQDDQIGVSTYEIYFFDCNLAAPTTAIYNGVSNRAISGFGSFYQATVVTEIEYRNNSAQTFTAGVAYLLGSE